MQSVATRMVVDREDEITAFNPEEYWILEAKLAADPGASWAQEAKRLLAVPEAVAKDLAHYTYDPAVLYAWRDAIADLIEKGETK